MTDVGQVGYREGECCGAQPFIGKHLSRYCVEGAVDLYHYRVFTTKVVENHFQPVKWVLINEAGVEDDLLAGSEQDYCRFDPTS